MNRYRNETTALGVHASGLAGLTAPVVGLVGGASAGAADLVKAILAGHRARRDRRRTLKELFALDDRLLADIGLARGDLLDVANRRLSIDELNARRSPMRRPAAPDADDAGEVTAPKALAAALDEAA